MVSVSKSVKQRVPAAERRDALISAAMEEFALGGLHGTPVDRIARRVGVAQPYVFSLFATKRDLFIAAIERCFENVTELFTEAASSFQAGRLSEDCTENEVFQAIGAAYIDLLGTDRTVLMLQLQAYRKLSDRVQQLSGADMDTMHDFMAFGMYLSVQAAMGGIEDLEAFKAERHDALQRREQADT